MDIKLVKFSGIFIVLFILLSACTLPFYAREECPTTQRSGSLAVPVYPGSVEVVEQERSQGEYYSKFSYFLTKDDPNTIFEYYEKELVKLGWHKDEENANKMKYTEKSSLPVYSFFISVSADGQSNKVELELYVDSCVRA